MTDEEIDAMLDDIDDVAREYDHYEYGLPTHNEETAAKMRAVVRRALNRSDHDR
jgi:hypothetical protein